MTTLERWFGLDEEWERPLPDRPALRRDARWAVLAFVIMAFGHELVRSMGGLDAFGDLGPGPVWEYVGISSLAALVAIRRRYPVATALLAGVHMIVLSVWMTMTMAQLQMQMLYFLLIFSGMAWARNRRALMAAIAAVLVLLVLYFSWSYALNSGITEIREAMMGEADAEGAGLLPPVPAVILFTVLSNGLFFGFAIILGQVAWNGALRQAQVVAQSETIRAQAEQLTDQAVVAERLRIARELHDVVAHHVSVMGVQATAARRVLDRDPEAARAAVTAIEQSSRDAVSQMRDLLGTLRTRSEPEAESAAGRGSVEGSSRTDRAPQPTLAALPALAEQASTPTCQVTLDVVESTPGAAARVAPPVQLSVYRIVQEGLANVRKHSTARLARATLRVDEEAGRLEVEIVDDGSPLVGTSGTGLGVVGMRERAQHLGGGVEVGPRRGGPGWRVRVWLPIDGRATSGTHGSPGAADVAPRNSVPPGADPAGDGSTASSSAVRR